MVSETPPQRKTADRGGVQWPVYLAIVICLIVTGLLCSLRLVAIAERMPFGPGRDALLAFTQGVHTLAHAIGFDGPARWVDLALGPRDALPAFSTTQVAQAASGEVAPPPPSSRAPGLTPPPTTSPSPTLKPTANPPTAQPTSVPSSPTVTAPPTLDAVATTSISIASASPGSDGTLAAPVVASIEPTKAQPATPASTNASPTPPTTTPANATGAPKTPSAATALPINTPQVLGTPAPASATGEASKAGPEGTRAAASEKVNTKATPKPDAAVAQRAVTSDNPLRVLVAGDSFAQPLGLEMQRYAAKFKLMDAQVDFKLSTGLARPDFYDWPKRIEAIMSAPNPPEVVVFFVGANDTQNMWTDNGLAMGRSPEWQAEYGRRAAVIMDSVGKRGSRLYWVGMPVMREQFRAEYASIQNDAVKSEIESRPWVHFVDIWTLFQGPDGGFSTYIADDTGEQVQVRQPDGVHLTWAGNGWVTALAYRAIERDFGFPPSE